MFVSPAQYTMSWNNNTWLQKFEVESWLGTHDGDDGTCNSSDVDPATSSTNSLVNQLTNFIFTVLQYYFNLFIIKGPAFSHCNSLPKSPKIYKKKRLIKRTTTTGNEVQKLHKG